jgi:hypothetical protein
MLRNKVSMLTYLEKVGRGGEVDDGQCHNICFVQNRPSIDLSVVGLWQQSQYTEQLEYRDWRCFFRPCMLGTRICAQGWPVTLDRFPLSKPNFPWMCVDDSIWNTLSVCVKSNIRWPCQLKRIAYAFSWLAFLQVLHSPSGSSSPRTFQLFHCTLWMWLVSWHPPLLCPN